MKNNSQGTRTKNRKLIIAIIPARFHSQRLRGKPLIDICGKPMIQRVYEQVMKSKLVDQVIVATDHKKIADTVRDFGGKVILTPKGIFTGTDRVAVAAKSLKTAEIIINVQGDEPLIPPEMVDEVITLMKNNANILVGTLVKKINSPEELNNPNKVKTIIDKNNYACYFSRAPIPYMREYNGRTFKNSGIWYSHVGIYAFRKKFLNKFYSWGISNLEKIEKLEQLRIIEQGYKIKVAVTKKDSVAVDTNDDVEKVRSLIKKKGTCRNE